MRRRVRSGRSRVDEKILDGYLTKETSHFLAEEVKALSGTMRITVEQLIDQLLPWVASRAMAPFSQFKVGAVVRGVSGSLYLGANIEFPGVPLHHTLHAEQVALANALSKGEIGVKAIAVTAPPCGHCRQFLNEINTASEIKIHVMGEAPQLLSEMLPSRFGPADLEIENRLFDTLDQQLILNSDGDDIVQKAFTAANKSYAPYTKSYAGVALLLENGQIFDGFYAENAAFNPSLLPLQAALANLAMGGRRFDEIKRAVLVQSDQSNVDHQGTSEKLLASLSGRSLETVNVKVSV